MQKVAIQFLVPRAEAAKLTELAAAMGVTKTALMREYLRRLESPDERFKRLVAEREAREQNGSR